MLLHFYIYSASANFLHLRVLKDIKKKLRDMASELYMNPFLNVSNVLSEMFILPSSFIFQVKLIEELTLIFLCFLLCQCLLIHCVHVSTECTAGLFDRRDSLTRCIMNYHSHIFVSTHTICYCNGKLLQESVGDLSKTRQLSRKKES